MSLMCGRFSYRHYSMSQVADLVKSYSGTLKSWFSFKADNTVLNESMCIDMVALPYLHRVKCCNRNW